MTKRPSLADSMKKLETPPPAPAEPTAMRPPGKERAYFAATRSGRKKVTVALEPEAHKQLKLLAVERGQTVENLLREAVSDMFRKYGKPPIA